MITSSGPGQHLLLLSLCTQSCGNTFSRIVNITVFKVEGVPKGLLGFPNVYVKSKFGPRGCQKPGHCLETDLCFGWGRWPAWVPIQYCDRVVLQLFIQFILAVTPDVPCQGGVLGTAFQGESQLRSRCIHRYRSQSSSNFACRTVHTMLTVY